MRGLNRTWRCLLVAASAALLLSAGSHAAQARQRLLIAVATSGMPGEDSPAWTRVPDLDVQLTELAIAAAAECGDHELVGLREAQRRLPSGPWSNDPGACLDDEVCLGALAEAADVQRALVGRLRWAERRMLLDLTLVDPFTLAAEGEWSRALDMDLSQLTAVFQEGVRALLAPKPKQDSPVGPVGSQSLAVAAPQAQVSFELRRPPPAPAARGASPWLPAIGYGTGALAAISFSAGAVAGGLGAVSPTGRTRADAQMDLQQRKEYAHVANDLLLIGSALAVVSLGTLLWHWRHHPSAP